jgi:hypothetical protein
MVMKKRKKNPYRQLVRRMNTTHLNKTAQIHSLSPSAQTKQGDTSMEAASVRTRRQTKFKKALKASDSLMPDNIA